MANSSKFRADHVGSLLRPQSVLEARRRVEAGMIDEDELRAVEDEAIAQVVKLQKDAGTDIITDGEFRRRDFRGGFADAFDGITRSVVPKEWRGPNGIETLPSVQYTVTERLHQKRRLAEGEAAYLRTLTSNPIKVTLIAPGFVVDRFWDDEKSASAYESREEFAAEVVAATRAEIEALLAEGVRYVQMDNPGYSAFLDPANRERLQSQGADPDAAFERMLGADTAAVDGLERPRGASIGVHICRGNQASMWLASGGYDAIAERLFSLPVDRFLLEYDDERAGTFEPLRLVPHGKMVVLGLVSSKSPELENIDDLMDRLDEAGKYVDWDFLALSPQCGFASVATHGNRMTAEDELKKLRLVSETALATWGIEL